MSQKGMIQLSSMLGAYIFKHNFSRSKHHHLDAGNHCTTTHVELLTSAARGHNINTCIHFDMNGVPIILRHWKGGVAYCEDIYRGTRGEREELSGESRTEEGSFVTGKTVQCSGY